MTFNLFTVRDYDDPSEDVMYPQADAATQSVKLTPDDGNNVKRAAATSVELGHWGKTKTHQQFRLDSIMADVVVTDSRLAIAVAKYDKGGGWVGGASALMFNAVSMARAKVRSRGTCLVGHLRYPWISVVGHSARYGLMGGRKNDQLKVVYHTPSPRPKKVITVVVEFDLAQDISGHMLADTIVRRVAKYRIDNDPRLSDENREYLEDCLSQGISSRVEKGKWTHAGLNGEWPAMPQTAVYGFDPTEPV